MGFYFPPQIHSRSISKATIFAMSNRQNWTTTVPRGGPGPSRQPQQQGQPSRGNQSSVVATQVVPRPQNRRWTMQPGETPQAFAGRMISVFTRSGRIPNVQAVEEAPGSNTVCESRVSRQTASGTQFQEHNAPRSELQNPGSTVSPGAQINRNLATGNSIMNSTASGPYSSVSDNETRHQAQMKSNANTCVMM